MEPPAFAGEPPTLAAAPGGSASVFVDIGGTPPFQYEWSRAGASLDDRFTVSEGAGGARLTVAAARAGDSGVYTLQASNAAGRDTARVRLDVSTETGHDPPSFLRRLQDLTVKVGTRTRLFVEILSTTECKVTWYRNERRLLEAERVSLARDGNFWWCDVACVSVDDAGRWTCAAENSGGRASCAAHLNVLVPKAYKRPEFVEELRAILTEQGTVSLECKVVGVPTPVLRWFKDSREIKAGDVFALTASAEDPTSLGTYTCEAVNCMGRAYSSSKVHVTRGRDESRPSSAVTPEPPPIFTKELDDQFVKICEHLTLGCHIVVPPWPRSVVWYNKEGKVEPGERYHVTEDGVGGYLLEVQSAEWPDEGEWKCVATSAGGRVGISTCHVIMDVPKNYRKPRFMENLQAVLTDEGLVSFECKVVGFPTPVLSWFKDGQELKPGDVYQLTGTNSLGSYCCIARNCMGQASSSAELTVEDIQNQLNEEEKLQLFSKNQAPKFVQGLKSVEAKIDEPFRFTIKVAIPPEPSVLWYRDDQPVDESTRCHLAKEDRGVFTLDVQNLEFLDQAEWKCVAMNDFGHSVTSCFLKLIIPRHYKKPRFLENLQAILSEEGAVNLECKVIGVPQPVLKWYKDGEELKPGDIHRIISGQDGTCCLGTYTCEAQNCMGIAASSASLLGFDDSMKAKKKIADEQALQRNLSLSTIHEERTSQMYDTPVGDITLDDKGEISFSFDGKEVSVSLYETPDLTEEEALQIVEMYADQLSENVTEHNVVELPPLRFVKETSTSGNLLMEAIIIDVSPEYFASPEEDLRTEADVEDISIADENGPPQLSLDTDLGEDYIEKTMALLSDEKSDIPKKVARKKSDSLRSGEDFFSLSREQSISENKRDDDTQVMSESDLVSFASARSYGKHKSKSSRRSIEDGRESSETKTILHKVEVEEVRETKTETQEIKTDLKEKITDAKESEHKRSEMETPVMKPKRERRGSRGSRRSSSGSEKSYSKAREELLQLKSEVELKPTMTDEEFKTKVTEVSSTISKAINDVQIIERDIILKSELMSSAATASRSLEIISSLISPLSEILSIAEAAKESIQAIEVSSIFSNLPQSMKALQQSLTLVEKCIDMESENKTLVKKTCVAFIETCGNEIQNVMSDINTVTMTDYLQADESVIREIQTLTKDMTNVIKYSSDTIKTRNLLSEAREIKTEETSVDAKHLKDTQKAVFELRSPLNSLLCIAESADSGKIIDVTKIKNSEVILHDMSASVQDLQAALEQIESLSVKESTTSLNRYNTAIIETVMDSVLKLRISFEQLSTETKTEDDKVVLKHVLTSIKHNLSDISTHIDKIESNIGRFDILQSDNKLEVLQKMAQILIALENNLPRLETLPEVKLHLDVFHKNLTKVLENVIETNEAKKYFSLIEICDVVNRVNTAIKTLDSDSILSLASLNNTLRIVQDHFVNNVFDSELNCAILNNITDVLVDIQESINQAEEISLQIDSEHIITQDMSLYETGRANVALERIDHTIAAISKVKALECTKELKEAITPVLENVCPVLEELKRSVASMAAGRVEQDENVSDMSDVQSIAQTLATPLCELNQNIMVINQTIVEHIESLKENSEVFVTVAEPLHELHTTLETLQQVVISQYGEDVTPYEVSINLANAVQNLNSCIVMIREQGGIEIADEMSTLEDISGIKTTADTLPSDHLVLPEATETTTEHAVSSLHQDVVPSATAQALQSLNDHITILQNPDVVDALDTLSEVSDYSSLKSVVLGLGELHSGIQEILHPFILETSDEIAYLNTSKLMAIAEPMQDLQQCLSVLDANNIPIYEHILEMPTDKIQSVFQSITEFKENLDKCIHAVFPAMETADKTIEISNKVETLRAVCEHLKDIIENTKAISIEVPVKQEVIALEATVNNLLDATDVSKGIRIEQVKSVTQELYKNVINVQEELIQFTPQAPEKLAQEAKMIQIIDKVERNIAVLEEYDFVDLSRASDMSCASPQIALEIETDALLQMDDIVQCAVGIIQDSSDETPVADLMMVEDFFKNCKNEFALLRCLLTKKLSHKRIIRLLQEFNLLKQTINDFKVKQNELRLAENISNSLKTFFAYCDECLSSVQSSLIKIVDSQSELLFKAPITKLETTKEVLVDILRTNKFTPLEDVAERFVNIIEIAKPCLQSAETVIHEEIKHNATVVEDKALLAAMDEAETFIEEQILTKSELTVESREILQKTLDCIQKHHDYKDATGTGKTLILLKCLAECSDILQENMSESKQEIKEHKFEDTALKVVLAEMLVPLQALHHQLLNVQDQVLTGMEDDVTSVDLTSTESFAQAVVEIQQDIKQLEQHVSEGTVVDSEEKTLIMELDKEIHTIQDSIRSTENVSNEDKEKFSKPMEEIKKTLKTLLATESKVVAKDTAPDLVQNVDQCIELINIVEEISTIINIDNVAETANLAEQLRQNVAISQIGRTGETKEVDKEMIETKMKQSSLAIKLTEALTSIQTQIMESTKDLEPELQNQVIMRIEQVAEQLQDFIKIDITQIEVKEEKPIDVFIESTTAEIKKEEAKPTEEKTETHVSEEMKTDIAVTELREAKILAELAEHTEEKTTAEIIVHVAEAVKEVADVMQLESESDFAQKKDVIEEIKPAPVIGETFEIITTEQLSTVETCVSIIVEGKTDKNEVTEAEKAKLSNKVEETDVMSLTGEKTVTTIELVQRIDEYLSQDLKKTELAGDIDEITKILNVANELRQKLTVSATTSEQIEVMKELQDLITEHVNQVAILKTEGVEHLTSATVRLCEALHNVIKTYQIVVDKGEKQEDITDLSRKIVQNIERSVEETLTKDTSKISIGVVKITEKPSIEPVLGEDVEQSQVALVEEVNQDTQTQKDEKDQITDVKVKSVVTEENIQKEESRALHKIVVEPPQIQDTSGFTKSENEAITESDAATISLTEPHIAKAVEITETSDNLEEMLPKKENILAMAIDLEESKLEGAVIAERVVNKLDDKKENEPDESVEEISALVEAKCTIAETAVGISENTLVDARTIETIIDDQEKSIQKITMKVKDADVGQKQELDITLVESIESVEEAISSYEKVADEKVIALKTGVAEVAPDELQKMGSMEIQEPLQIEEPREVGAESLHKPDAVEIRFEDSHILTELEIVKATEDTVKELDLAYVEETQAVAISIETLVQHLDEFLIENYKINDVLVLSDALKESLSIAQTLQCNLKDDANKEIVKEIGEQQIQVSLELKEALNRIDIITLESVGDIENKEEKIKKLADITGILRSDLDHVTKLSQVAIQNTVTEQTEEKNAAKDAVVTLNSEKIEKIIIRSTESESQYADEVADENLMNQSPIELRTKEPTEKEKPEVKIGEIKHEVAEESETKVVVMPNIESFKQHIDKYVSEKVSHTLNTLSNTVHSEAMAQSITIAKEVQKNFNDVENIEDFAKKIIKKTVLLEKLQNALIVLQVYTNDATEDLKSKLGDGLYELAEVATHLNADLQAIVSQAKSVLADKTTEDASNKSVSKEVLATSTSTDNTSNHTSQVTLQSGKLDSKDLREDVKLQDQSKIDQATNEEINISKDKSASETEIIDQVASLELLTTSVGEATERLAAILTQSIRDEEIKKLKDQDEDKQAKSIGCLTEMKQKAIAGQAQIENVAAGIETEDLKADTCKTKVKTPIDTATLVQQIDELTSARIADSVEVLSKIIDVTELKESIAVAHELKDSFMEIEKVQAEAVSIGQAKLVEKLQGALEAFQSVALENTENIIQNLDVYEWANVSEVVAHLQDELAKATVTEPTTEMAGKSLNHLESLLQEVTDKIGTTERSLDDTELLRDNLDEIQTVIIKLKRDYDGGSNDTLNETLEDLECSVRSVQLQITEDSPPELLKEACETLQLLVNNMNGTEDITGAVVREVKTNSLLEKSSDETEATVKLINMAIESKGDMSKIVENLSVLKDVMQVLRNNFLKDADTLIDKGVEVIQSLDQVEEKVFALEKDIVDIPDKVKESIFNAVHSVYGSISNMRSTVQSIQKRYMHDNYGKPSEDLLKAMKNVNNKNWKSLSKSLRKVLNHFEDIKFYINLDKTARLPSDAAFTKIILNELKLSINETVKPHSENSLEVARTYLATIKGIESHLKKMEPLTSLEVKQKIPIFKEVATLLLKMTEATAKCSDKEAMILENIDNVDMINTEAQETVDLKQSDEPETAEPISTQEALHSSSSEIKIIEQEIEQTSVLTASCKETKKLSFETPDTLYELKPHDEVTYAVVSDTETRVASDTELKEITLTQKDVKEEISEVHDLSTSKQIMSTPEIDTKTSVYKEECLENINISANIKAYIDEPQPSTSKQEDQQQEPKIDSKKLDQEEKSVLSLETSSIVTQNVHEIYKPETVVTTVEQVQESHKPAENDKKDVQNKEEEEKKEDDEEFLKEKTKTPKKVKSLKPKKDEETQTDDEDDAVKDLAKRIKKIKLKKEQDDKTAQLKTNKIEKPEKTEVMNKNVQKMNETLLTDDQEASKPVKEKVENDTKIQQKPEEKTAKNEKEPDTKEELTENKLVDEQVELKSDQNEKETFSKNEPEGKENKLKKELSEADTKSEKTAAQERKEEALLEGEKKEAVTGKRPKESDDKQDQVQELTEAITKEKHKQEKTDITTEGVLSLTQKTENEVEMTQKQEEKDAEIKLEQQVKDVQLKKELAEEVKDKLESELKEVKLKKEEEEQAKLKAKQDRKEAKLKKIQEDKEAQLKKIQEDKDAKLKVEQEEQGLKLKQDQEERDAQIKKVNTETKLRSEQGEKAATLKDQPQESDQEIARNEEPDVKKIVFPAGQEQKDEINSKDEDEKFPKEQVEKLEKLGTVELPKQQEDEEVKLREHLDDKVTSLEEIDKKAKVEIKDKNFDLQSDVEQEEKPSFEKEKEDKTTVSKEKQDKTGADQQESKQKLETEQDYLPSKEQEEMDGKPKSEQEQNDTKVKKETEVKSEQETEAEQKKGQADKDAKLKLEQRVKETKLKKEEEEKVKLQAKQEKKEAKLKKIQGDKEAKLKIVQNEKDAKLKQDQEEKKSELTAEQERKEVKLKTEQETNETELRTEQEKKEAKLKDEQKEVEVDRRAKQEEKEPKLKVEQREKEAKAEQEEEEAKRRGDQEKEDTKLKKQQVDKDVKLLLEQEKKTTNLNTEEIHEKAELKVEQENKESKLTERSEGQSKEKEGQKKDEARLMKETSEIEAKHKAEQKGDDAELKKDEAEKQAKLQAEQEETETKWKKEEAEKEAKHKLEEQVQEAKLRKEKEEKAKLKLKQERKEAKLKKIQEDKEAKVKKEQEEKEAKLKQEQDQKEALLRKEQEEKESKLRAEQEEREANLKKEQEKEAKLQSEQEQKKAALEKEQKEIETKIQNEQEEKDAIIRKEQEKVAQIEKEREEKEAKLKAEQVEKAAQIKIKNQEIEAMAKLELEQKEAKLKKEQKDIDATLKAEQEKKEVALKKEQEQFEAKLKAEGEKKEAEVKKDQEKNETKLKIEHEVQEAKLKKEQEEEVVKLKAKQERKEAKLKKIQKDKEAKLRKEQEENDAQLKQQTREEELSLKKAREEKDAALKGVTENKKVEDKDANKLCKVAAVDEKRSKKDDEREDEHFAKKENDKKKRRNEDNKPKLVKDESSRKLSASHEEEKQLLFEINQTKEESLKKVESDVETNQKSRTSIEKSEVRIRDTRRENGDAYREKTHRDDISSYRDRKVDEWVKSETHQQRDDERRRYVDNRSKEYTSDTHSHYLRDEEKRRFVDHSTRDYTSEFARPSNYREKTYQSDNFHVDTAGKGITIYKAQTLVLDAELRSSVPPRLETSRKSEPTERRIELKHKTKAVSEARSILSEKRSSMPRDVRRKPVFSTYLTDRTAVEGSRVKLTCSVLSSVDPTITWFKNGVLIDNKLKYRTKFVDGLVTLEVLNAVPADSAEYNCTVENENGSVSTTATLKVYPSFEASPIPPTFTRSIRDNYHLAENELVLECRIRGQPLPTITWLKDDRPATNERYQAYYLADGVCRLAISHPTPEDSGKYTCKAENSVWSDQITHVVSFTGKESRLSPNLQTIERTRFTRQAMESRRPHFTNVLTDYKVARGGTIGLQVEIRGCPTRVEWLREGKSVTDVYRNAKTFVEQGLYTLALSDVTEKETGMYTCRAWSMHGNVDMNAAITVVHPAELDGKPAIIAGRPEKDVLISVGEDLNISFRVQGEPKPKVVFMKGTRDITNSQRVCKMTSDDYVKFTVKRSVISDAGTYCILARNAYGCDRAFVTVVVRQRASSESLISDWTYPLDDTAVTVGSRNYDSVPRIPSEPSVVDGGNNWISLAWPKPETSSPVLAYKVESWLLGKEGGARWTELGITPRNSFDIFNLKQGEQYHFRVTLRNRYGWGESVQTSSPIGVGLAGDRPEFVDILPGQLKVLVGTTANLSCSVKGNPIPEVVWMRNGHEVEDDRMKMSFNGYNCSLVISDIRGDDEARYSCEATNEHGRSSTYARLAVVTDRLVWEADAKLKRERSSDVPGDYPPQFTMRLRDRRVQATYPVRLTCQVVGSPTPTVTWYKDGEEVYKDNRHTHFKDELFHTLEIAPTTLEDGGVYSCEARNERGAVSCRCSLVVDKGIRAYVAPEICCGLDPLYRLREGDELRITAVVEAYPSVGVTWYRDGIRLRPSRRAVMTLDRDGQIELALAFLTGRDAGVYTCTASNEVGSASTSGKVEVIEGPVVEKRAPPALVGPDVPYSKEPMFIRKPRSSEAYEGDTVIIECEVTGDPKPDVYWLRDFLKPDYYRDASHFKRVGAGPEYRFEIPHAKLDYTGAYSVVARNVHGEAKAIISLQILVKDLSSTDDSHNVRYGRVDVIPRFERNLNDLLSYDGDAIEFECRVTGHPEPDIRWYHYAELIRDCPYLECTFDAGAARLRIKQVTADDEGTYTCEACNSLGKASTSACLVVYPPGEPNTLSARLRRPALSAASTPRSTPRSTPARSISRTTTPAPDMKRLSSPSRQMAPSFYTYPFNKVVEEGETVVFQCAVKGLPSPWATWDKDGIIVTPSSRITVKEKDEIRMLEIEHVTIEDVGLYRVCVENDYGRAEGSARLEVITQGGKFFANMRAYSASPRRSAPYRKRCTSNSKD